MRNNELATQYVAGVDLHRKPISICIMDRAGTIILEQTFSRHKQARLRKCLAPYGRDVTVGVEATYNWYWLADWCGEQGIPCDLGDPMMLHRKALGKNKSDRIDARQMANLLRINEFPVVEQYPAAWRATRDLARLRVRLTTMQTALTLRHQCMEEQYLMSERSEQMLNGPHSAWYRDVWTAFDTAQPVQQTLKEQIGLIEQRLAERAPIDFPQGYALLTGVRGIGTVLTATVLYETGVLSRFPRVQQYSSYSRVVNAQRESSNKRVGSGASKCGNPYLCWAFHLMVDTTRRQMPELQAVYQGLRRRRGPADAHRILAHHWAVTTYFMLKSNEPFSLERFVRKFRGTAPEGEPAQWSGRVAMTA